MGEGGECCEVVEGGNSSRDGRGEGEKRTVGEGERQTVGEGEKCTVDNERDHSLFCITDEALNGIPLGVLIPVPTSEHATRPPSLSLSTHTDTSARDSSAQPHSQQLIDFSSSSSHDAEWRPLDVSGDRLNSPSPLPSPPLSTTSHTPLSHPLKCEFFTCNVRSSVVHKLFYSYYCLCEYEFFLSAVEENHSNGGIGLFGKPLSVYE